MVLEEGLKGLRMCVFEKEVTLFGISFMAGFNIYQELRTF